MVSRGTKDGNGSDKDAGESSFQEGNEGIYALGKEEHTGNISLSEGQCVVLDCLPIDVIDN